MASTIRYFLCLLSICVWLGGLTFYAAVVVPIGAELVGSVEQGSVTQVVTHRLNAIGFVTLAILAWNVWLVRSRTLRISYWILVVVQCLLVCSHALLDNMFDAETLSVPEPNRFYNMHRIYLLLTAVQWFAGIVHLWGLAAIAQASPRE